MIKTGIGKVAGYVERKFGGVVGGSGTFPDEVFSGKAPRQITPTGKLEDRAHIRVSTRTGRPETSKVQYDRFGRQTGRTDYSDHFRPQNHTNPHHHKTDYNYKEYAKGYKDSGPLPGPYPGH